MDAVTTLIPIKASYACPRCGCTNLWKDEEMAKDVFEENARAHPDEYWKEDKGGTIYRRHEESGEGRCDRAC